MADVDRSAETPMAYETPWARLVWPPRDRDALAAWCASVVPVQPAEVQPLHS